MTRSPVREMHWGGLSVFLLALLAVPIGCSEAWCDAGDDALGAYLRRNYPRAIQLAQPPAQNGNLLAQFTLGTMYEQGDGVPQDKSKAEKLFQLVLRQAKAAAEKGDASAQFVLGRLYEEGWALPKNEARAADWFRKAADKGNVHAQVYLGIMYDGGVGVAQDQKEAVTWFRKAVEQGDVQAQSILGWMYDNGRGVAKDQKEAALWYRKAAEQGFPIAQESLGVLYANGEGVVKDEKTAAAWYLKAAEQGYDEAQLKLARMYESSGEGVPRDNKEATKWYRKAAEQGNAEGQINLGLAYADGRVGLRNFTEAVKWYRKAADQGHAGGQMLVAMAYQTGDGVMKDSAQAAQWFRKSAEQGHAPSQEELGLIYEIGQGVAQNFAEAVNWYRKAAEQGNLSGQYNLGRMYESGRGIPQDDVEAYSWYALAAAQEDAFLSADENARKQMAILEDRMTSEQVATAQKHAASFSTTSQDRHPAIDFDALEPEFVAESQSTRVDTPTFNQLPNPNNFALVVGIEKYQKLPAAEFSEHDADTMRKYLLRMGYPERNIIYLKGENATRSRLSAYLDEWLPKNVNDDSTVFVYFSGHGAPSVETKQAFLVPWDADAQFLQSTAYPLSQLYSSLNHLKAKNKIVVLDTCFSGSGGRSVLAKGTRPLVTKVAASDNLGSVVLFAGASEDEVTGTLDEQRHGVFTYYFLKGLAGEAKDVSGAVTAMGLYRYLKPLVQDASHRQNREQTPLLGGVQRDIELVNFK